MKALLKIHRDNYNSFVPYTTELLLEYDDTKNMVSVTITDTDRTVTVSLDELAGTLDMFKLLKKGG